MSVTSPEDSPCSRDCSTSYSRWGWKRGTQAGSRPAPTIGGQVHIPGQPAMCTLFWVASFLLRSLVPETGGHGGDRQRTYSWLAGVCCWQPVCGRSVGGALPCLGLLALSPCAFFLFCSLYFLTFQLLFLRVLRTPHNCREVCLC